MRPMTARTSPRVRSRRTLRAALALIPALVLGAFAGCQVDVGDQSCTEESIVNDKDRSLPLRPAWRSEGPGDRLPRHHDPRPVGLHDGSELARGLRDPERPLGRLHDQRLSRSGPRRARPSPHPRERRRVLRRAGRILHDEPGPLHQQGRQGALLDPLQPAGHAGGRRADAAPERAVRRGLRHRRAVGHVRLSALRRRERGRGALASPPAPLHSAERGGDASCAPLPRGRGDGGEGIVLP